MLTDKQVVALKPGDKLIVVNANIDGIFMDVIPYRISLNQVVTSIGIKVINNSYYILIEEDKFRCYKADMFSLYKAKNKLRGDHP